MIDIVIPIRRGDNISLSLINSLYENIKINNLIIDDSIGVGLSRNNLLNVVTTKYFISVDADTPYISRKWFDEVNKIINSNNKIAVVNSPIIMGNKNNILYKYSLYNNILNNNAVSLTGAIMNTEIIKYLGGFKKLKSGEDVELKNRVLKNGYLWVTCKYPLMQPRTVYEDFKHLMWWSQGYSTQSKNLKTVLRRLLNIKKNTKKYLIISKDIKIFLYIIIRNLVWIIGYMKNYYNHHYNK